MQIETPQIDPTLWLRFNLGAKHRGMDPADLLDEVLRRFLGLPESTDTTKSEEKAIFERLAGTWTQEEAEEFERNTEWTRQIDPDLWK